MSTPFTVSVVCTGNICRSPIGEVVIRDAFARAGLSDRVRVVSAGTGDWHLGQGADHRAEQVMREHGLSLDGHAAQQFSRADFAAVDLVLALDAGHVAELRTLAPDDAARDKVRLLRSFDPTSVAEDELEVADPYYGDLRDFQITYEEIVDAAPGVVEYVRERL